MYTNAQKLAAVLHKWAQPAIQGLIGSKIDSLPFLGNIQEKVRSMGWVSPQWSLGKEFSPFFKGVTSSMIEPLLTRYLSNIPDEAIPLLAHNFVNDAIEQGGLVLFEGNVEFELEDLKELQKYLMYNLPIKDVVTYQVLTEEPTPQG